jgi:transposase InsO family protein
MIRFVDLFKDRFGVEPNCVTLAGTERGFITARGYRAAKTRPSSVRSLRDELLLEEITRIHGANYSVYGVRKMHAAMRQAGWEVGCDQVACLMRKAGLRGAIRGRQSITTTPAAKAAGLFPDLVGRRFTADAPNRLWVADITFVTTWSGFAYVAFVTDAFSRKIVGWNVSSRLTTEFLPLQALDMASWAATHDLTGLVHHADHGSQYLSLRYSERLADPGIQASTGSVGDNYDNALAETIHGPFKTELIKPRKPWRTVEEVELATLEWVWWFNNTCLHSELGYRTPNETENAYYDSQHSRTPVGAPVNR